MQLMQLSIFAITTPRAPQGICTENLPPLWGFCILIFAGGGGEIFAVGPEGWAFVYKRFFSLLSQELAIDNTLGFNIYTFFKKIFQTSSTMSKVSVEIQLFS